MVTNFITDAGFIGVPVCRLTSGAPPSAGATSRLTCEGVMCVRASAAITGDGTPEAAAISASSGVGASSNAWADAARAALSGNVVADEAAEAGVCGARASGAAPELQAARNNPAADRHANIRLLRQAAGRKCWREEAVGKRKMRMAALLCLTALITVRLLQLSLVRPGKNCG